MTTYNENVIFLRSCIDSICKQTFKNLEFIIVVEPDEINLNFLRELAQIDQRIKIIRNDNKLGVASSRNRAITESTGQFVAIIDKMNQEKPGFKKLIYGNYSTLTVISKIVRYNQTDSWGTTPHRDKSALTFIWDSTDKNDESLIVCSDIHNPSTKNLALPKRQFSQSKDCTSTILIPGLSLQKVGFPLPATVHGVLPFTSAHRFAVISFLLVPDIDMSSVVADFND